LVTLLLVVLAQEAEAREVLQRRSEITLLLEELVA
jgi:hypothetical protein